MVRLQLIRVVSVPLVSVVDTVEDTVELHVEAADTEEVTMEVWDTTITVAATTTTAAGISNNINNNSSHRDQ